MQSLLQSSSSLWERKGDIFFEFSLSKVLIKISCCGKDVEISGKKNNSQVDGHSNVGHFDLVYHRLKYP